ncbi:MAG TPA: PEP-CTERM sorting domain-containing protein [Rubrivivax sp.]|nr:PEP-CTERM sorting domain-containing protein [Rubrivivax sp.]
MILSSRFLSVALLAALPLSSHAFTGITDRPGDFLSTFAGRAASADLDVISASAFYNAGTDQFTIVGTMNGAIGLTPTGLYVWGVNRGAGTAGFAANGIDGVRFDRVIILRPDGTGTVAGAGNLPAGSVTITGNTITGVISGSLLPSTGFTNKLDYTWNLWPRDNALPAGFTQISDFAPDNSNFSTTPVPEPATTAMLLAGLAAIGGLQLRRRRAD